MLVARGLGLGTRRERQVADYVPDYVRWSVARCPRAVCGGVIERRRVSESSGCVLAWVVYDVRSNGCATRRVVCVVGCGLSRDAAHVRVVMATGVQSRSCDGPGFVYALRMNLRHCEATPNEHRARNARRDTG